MTELNKEKLRKNIEKQKNEKLGKIITYFAVAGIALSIGGIGNKIMTNKEKKDFITHNKIEINNNKSSLSINETIKKIKERKKEIKSAMNQFNNKSAEIVF